MGYNIPTTRANIIMIQGKRGFLGCGYFDVATADRLAEALAVVTGVKTYEDMLSAKVVRLSKAAEALGVQLGMTGEEALARLN